MPELVGGRSLAECWFELQAELRAISKIREENAPRHELIRKAGELDGRVVYGISTTTWPLEIYLAWRKLLVSIYICNVRECQAQLRWAASVMEHHGNITMIVAEAPGSLETCYLPSSDEMFRRDDHA